tara:strand:+ start:9627 stop:10490 length:864 start_codon:yes stop_codon:yes gene_type:complete
MISVVGIGNAASAIAEKFKQQKNYNVYLLNNKVERNSKYKYKLKVFDKPEEYEQNIPDLKKFFADLNDHVQVFVVGASYSSNYSLGILQQIKNKKIDLFYIKPDIELITGIPRLLENIAFGVLQEYARSALFNTITIVSNLEIEKNIQNISIKSYYDSLNSTIFSAVHYLNFFNHTEPEIGQVSRPPESNRIRSIGMLDPKSLKEKWFFELDMPRNICYYLCINEEKLENETGLHKRIVDVLKEKPRNAFKKISYAIYGTHLQDFGFCVAHTNAIQQQKTLDKLEQE